MSHGPYRSRPSSPLGARPLVASRSEPTLPSAPSTARPTVGETGGRRIERPPRDSPPPDAVLRTVRQLHPATPSPDTSPPARLDAKQAAWPDAKAPARPEAKAGGAPGALVRFVGGFIVTPQAALEEDNDMLTVLAESIQRAVQQQPDSALPSSGDATPQTRPPTPRPPDDSASPHRPSGFRIQGEDNTN